MNSHVFSLVLSKVDINTPNLEDKLFESGCDDSLICFYGTTVYIEFEREANTFEQAIVSAIKDVEGAGLGAIVKSVDAGDYVGLSDVSKLTDITKQSIALLKDGKRGGGGFPNPVLRLTSKQPLWRWADVANWLSSNKRIDLELARNALTVENINLALGMREAVKFDQVMTLTHAITTREVRYA